MGEGYTISLRRLERALAQLGLTPIDCVGKPYDPELMAALSTVNDSKHPQGYVVNEVRRGYLRNGQLFRCAEVIVAR
jgi:molecular chaperone GrpE